MFFFLVFFFPPFLPLRARPAGGGDGSSTANESLAAASAAATSDGSGSTKSSSRLMKMFSKTTPNDSSSPGLLSMNPRTCSAKASSTTAQLGEVLVVEGSGILGALYAAYASRKERFSPPPGDFLIITSGAFLMGMAFHAVWKSNSVASMAYTP